MDQIDIHDITPLPRVVAEHEFFLVEYTEEYATLNGIYRQLLDQDERSERALIVTGLMIGEVPSNNTVWWFRRQIFNTLYPPDQLEKRKEELQKVVSIIRAVSNNFQAWEYRKELVDSTISNLENDESIVLSFLPDGRNHRFWRYLQWYCDRWDQLDYGFKFTNSVILTDPGNNSAWATRHTFAQKIGESLEDELKFTLNLVRRRPDNKGPLLYLRSIVQRNPHLIQQILEEIENLLSKHPESVCLLETKVFIKQYSGEDVNDELHQLIEKDPLHRHYWELILRKDPRILPKKLKE